MTTPTTLYRLMALQKSFPNNRNFEQEFHDHMDRLRVVEAGPGGHS